MEKNIKTKKKRFISFKRTFKNYGLFTERTKFPEDEKTIIVLLKFNFCKFANFFADSKSKAQELSNDVSLVIFGHQTWDLEGGVNPPPSVSWFSSTLAGIGLSLNEYVMEFLKKNIFV